MANAAFRDSTIVDSDVTADAFKYNVTTNNSPIGSMTVNYSYFYGGSQTGRPPTETLLNYAAQEMPQTQGPSSGHEQRRTVTFAEEATSRIRRYSSVRSQIPANISRLPTSREEVPGPAYSTGSSYSVTGKTTTTGGILVSHFEAKKEGRNTLEGHLDLRIGDSTIREYMKSSFFLSGAAVPLWEASPALTSPEGMQTSNVCVGDVGFFTPGGGFYVLFNAFLSYTANKALDFDPPEGFEPYGPVNFAGDVSAISSIPYTDYESSHGDFKLDAIPRHPERTYISSYKLVNQNPKTLRSGTVLDLPNGFWRDQILLRVVTAMQNYFGLHAKSWYKYYLKQPSGPTIPKGSLYFVSGSYKCSAWALAYCSTLSPEHIFARLYKPYPNSDIFYQWDRQGLVGTRKGPHLEQFGRDGLALNNQCVAVEVYSLVKENSFGSISKIISRLSIRSRTSTVKSRMSF